MAAVPSAQRQWAIGVDVGGTKIAAAAVDVASGAVRHRWQTGTHPERGPTAVRHDIETGIAAVAAALHDDGAIPAAVGLGVPELVDSYGHITSSALVDWTAASPDCAVAPLFIEADVRAAALAEAVFGAGRRHASWVYINIGTGISSVFVLGGTPWAGARGGALVLSSGRLSVPCADGGWSDFVLEAYAAGPALARRYTEVTGSQVSRAEEVLGAASRGDAAAIDTVVSAAHVLGSAIGWLVNVYDPEAVVLGGGLALAPGLFRDRLAASIREHIWHPPARDLPIEAARLGADAGVIGAAIHAARAVGEGTIGTYPGTAVMTCERR